MINHALFFHSCPHKHVSLLIASKLWRVCIELISGDKWGMKEACLKTIIILFFLFSLAHKMHHLAVLFPWFHTPDLALLAIKFFGTKISNDNILGLVLLIKGVCCLVIIIYHNCVCAKHYCFKNRSASHF